MLMRTRSFSSSSPLPLVELTSSSIRRVQLLDELEIVQQSGAKILDWHTCDMFPERWIDLVVVLRCDHAQLWNRLEKRCVFLLPSLLLLPSFSPFLRRFLPTFFPSLRLIPYPHPLLPRSQLLTLFVAFIVATPSPRSRRTTPRRSWKSY
jgi:hypothetical protein